MLDTERSGAFVRLGENDLKTLPFNLYFGMGLTGLGLNPSVRIHYTPTYSSWLNQVSIWFSKIQRDVISHGVFTSVKDLARKLLRYIRNYNRTATPMGGPIRTSAIESFQLLYVPQTCCTSARANHIQPKPSVKAFR
jgi:hypothetical protein